MIRATESEPLAVWLERAWLSRYLDHELSDEEGAWFETYALDRADLLDAIESDTRLRDGWVQHSPTIQSDSDVVAPVVQRSSARLVRGYRQRWIGLAAALAIGLGLGGFAQHALLDTPGLATVANPTRIIYDTMRGEPTGPRIEHADSSAGLVLVEIAVPPDAEQIRLSIDDLPRMDLLPSPDGFVSFVMDRTRLDQARTGTLAYVAAGHDRSRTITLGPMMRGRK
jgi:hypothetical protein